MIDQPEAELAAISALLGEAAARAADWTSARLRFAIVGRETIAEAVVECPADRPVEFTPAPRTCAIFEALALASVREREGLWISLDAVVGPNGRASFEENWREPVVGLSGDPALAPGLDDYAAFFAEFPRDDAFLPSWAPRCGQTTVRARIEAALDSHAPLERLDEGELPMPLARESGLRELVRDEAWREFIAAVRCELGRGISDVLLVSAAGAGVDAFSLAVPSVGGAWCQELSDDDRARVRAAFASVVRDAVGHAGRPLARRHVFEAVRMARRALALQEADVAGPERAVLAPGAVPVDEWLALVGDSMDSAPCRAALEVVEQVGARVAGLELEERFAVPVFGAA